MTVTTVPLRLELTGDTQVENITGRVRQGLEKAALQHGVVTVFIQHTTASVVVIEDEPGIRSDTKAFWDRLIPAAHPWQHNIRNAGEDNGHSHLRGQLQGCSVVIPFAEGALLLGTWQQIVVIDFDTRPRTRELILQFIGE